MTTHSTEAKRRWWQYLGPWPLYPLAVGSLMAVTSFVSQVYGFTPINALPSAMNSIFFGGVVGSVLWLGRRFLPRVVASWWGYVGILLAAVAIGGFVRWVQGALIDYGELSEAGQFALYFWRALPFVFGVQILMGASQAALARQVRATERALTTVEQQAGALLRADEEIRRSVAVVLHDRVQAGILAACLRLQIVRDTGTVDEVQRVIDDLEALRSIDIRRAVRALSPNLTDLDLLASLDDLADAYRPAVHVSVRVEPACSPDPQARLAVYRIAEQALMNAIAHGQAAHVEIDVRRSEQAALATITDDGHGVPANAAAGFGTTLIDTWCRTLGGTWTRRPRPEGGTVVTLRIPQRRSTDTLGISREP